MEPRPEPRRNDDHEAARRERRDSRVAAALAAVAFVVVCGVIALVGSAAGSTTRPDSGASGIGGAQAAPTHITGPFAGPGPHFVAHGAPIHIGGRLSAASGGTPIGNAPVTVWAAYSKRGSAGHRVMHTRTRADGTYSLTLSAGPSRKVGVSFGGTRAYRPSRTPTVAVQVAARKGRISNGRARTRTSNFARASCRHDRHCRKYGASACTKQNHGVACAAWNYERHRGRYTCKRILLWRSRYGPPHPFGGWGCRHEGWNWGPNRHSKPRKVTLRSASRTNTEGDLP